MFEPSQEQQQAGRKRVQLSVILVAGFLAVSGALFYMSRRSAKPQAPPAASAAAPVKGEADPVHDLKIQRATMDKDRTGTIAVWLVSIENRSTVYTYSAIRYETEYIGADNKPILVNQGTIPITIGAGQLLNREVRDALYPTGTAWYKFKITGAKSSVQ